MILYIGGSVHSFLIIFCGECTSEAAELGSFCSIIGEKNPFPCLSTVCWLIIYDPCSLAPGCGLMNHRKERKDH